MFDCKMQIKKGVQFLKNKGVKMCGVAFMFVGRSVKEVLPLHTKTMHHTSCYVYSLGYSVSRPSCKQRQVTRWWVECTTDLITVSGKARRQTEKHYLEMIQTNERESERVRGRKRKIEEAIWREKCAE